jgi:hypothetical protein
MLEYGPARVCAVLPRARMGRDGAGSHDHSFVTSCLRVVVSSCSGRYWPLASTPSRISATAAWICGS